MDRAAMFMLRDVDSKASGVFATCGLVTEKGSWQRKPSWYYLATMRKALKGMRFGGELPLGRNDVRVYRFDAVKGKAKAYAAWCPTREDKHVSFRLPVAAGAKRQISLADGRTEGISKPLPAGSFATLEVSETPVFVIVG
jgi:hypothetical protein